MYISGRLHAGVAALSQTIPTVLLSYGHKNRGFARLLHQEKYVFEGGSPEKLKAMIEDAWKSREETAEILIDRMPKIRELADLSFEIVREIVDYKTSFGDNIPKEISDTWVKRSEQI